MITSSHDNRSFVYFVSAHIKHEKMGAAQYVVFMTKSATYRNTFRLI